MRIVNVNSLVGDEVLGKPIYDDSGRIMLSQGVKLSHFYIERLKSLDIKSVCIDDEISKDIEIEENISEKTRQMSKAAIKDLMDKSSRSGAINNDGIIKSVNSIIDDILSNKDIMLNISEVRAKDNNMYSHLVNVCVMCSVIGIHLGYNMLKLKDIAIGGLLHDIGKTKILADKKLMEELRTEEERKNYIQQMHPKVGYDFLGQLNLCGAVSKVAVLMHHERVDGTGFPLKLKGNEINEAARLVAICDTFDNLISGGDNIPPKAVYEVLEYLVGMSGYYFDAQMVKKFSMNIAAFPSGSGVVLNTNEKGLVLRQNVSMPLRPVVKVLYNAKGERLTEPYDIDLNKELTVFITKPADV